ncbi:MAG: molybdate transport system substrate-binding protein [Methylobacteriaceae bacterium]|nr:molybdate transport system substrate-binding protein [Methylobacteriaceae bacterium]
MKYTLALAVAALLHAGAPSMAAEITIMSGGAPKEVLAALVPQFEKVTGHQVKVTYAVIAALQQKLASGERPDMVLLPTSAIADLAKAGTLKSEGSAPFGTIEIVAIVRDGAPRPDISTPDAFRSALINARSLVYSPPTTPSGAHLARLAERLGVAGAIKDKVTYRAALDGGVQVVADGKAEIGIYQSSEVVHVKGVSEVGPLPDALQLKLVYGGAVTAANPAPEPALALIKFLADAQNKQVWKGAGFEPS